MSEEQEGFARRNMERSWLVCFVPPHPLRFICLRCGYQWKREEPPLSSTEWLDRVLALDKEHRKCPPATGWNMTEREF